LVSSVWILSVFSDSDFSVSKDRIIRALQQYKDAPHSPLLITYSAERLKPSIFGSFVRLNENGPNKWPVRLISWRFFEPVSAKSLFHFKLLSRSKDLRDVLFS
jgi:hypothetical protein